MFVENKYYTLYKKICNSHSDGVVERHHIVPRSLGGTNDDSNIVKLSPRKHFIAHKCLIRCTIGIAKKKMVYALWQMTNRNGNKNGKQYETLRLQIAEWMANNRKTGVISRKYFPLSDAHKHNISTTLKKKGIRPPSRKGSIVTFSDSHKKHLSQALTGSCRSSESRLKQSNTRKGLRWKTVAGQRIFYRD